jgi:hypothetical protein
MSWTFEMLPTLSTIKFDGDLNVDGIEGSQFIKVKGHGRNGSGFASQGTLTSMAPIGSDFMIKRSCLGDLRGDTLEV